MTGGDGLVPEYGEARYTPGVRLVAILARRNNVPATVIAARTPLRRWCSGAARDFAALVATSWKPLAASMFAVAAVAAVLAR